MSRQALARDTPPLPELWRLSAAEIAGHVGRRELSATQVARAALARLEKVNPYLNAVVDYRPQDTLEQAQAVDQALARGVAPGPLAGVPVTVKINTDQRGYATSNGLLGQKDLIADSNSPVVDNLRRAGAVIIGRSNTPAFSYRWFTDNRLHGRTQNPHDAALTPGGSSGGAAAAVAAGIGCIGHGTDIAGSIRYPAYACGVHGLRPSLGRVAAFNASGAERTIGAQLMAVSGPIARTVNDLRLGLAALSAPDGRDPWWSPAPLRGPDAPRVAALCLNPDGMATQPEVAAALLDAAQRLRDAGWIVEEVAALPPIREACELQIGLWLGEGYEAMVEAATREGDAGAIAALAGQASIARAMNGEKFSQALRQRATITRRWQLFLERYPVVVLPVSAELPFAVDLDLQGPQAYARVWQAQMTMVGLAVTGLPALALATGRCGSTPVGVQIVAGRYREDLCLAAGEAIEARGGPIGPVDAVSNTAPRR